ncbi:MAG: AbrB/MazE/SpoVT family DNA-binding domain-containing protein [Candidatus Gracilibacteria bacterium]|nr:AbrB/MazE/SpoVT family DNA-binding domain-containing protein [Candidatus Gracilibacteria bacterium]
MKKHNCDMKLYGTTTIGAKGQIVIPKEIRDKLDLKTGDSISILLKNDKFIGLIRNNDLTELMEFIKQMESENNNI